VTDNVDVSMKIISIVVDGDELRLDSDLDEVETLWWLEKAKLVLLDGEDDEDDE
jgi:hypothetical protein